MPRTHYSKLSLTAAVGSVALLCLAFGGRLLTNPEADAQWSIGHIDIFILYKNTYKLRMEREHIAVTAGSMPAHRKFRQFELWNAGVLCEDLPLNIDHWRRTYEVRIPGLLFLVPAVLLGMGAYWARYRRRCALRVQGFNVSPK